MCLLMCRAHVCVCSEAVRDSARLCTWKRLETYCAALNMSVCLEVYCVTSDTDLLCYHLLDRNIGVCSFRNVYRLQEDNYVARKSAIITYICIVLLYIFLWVCKCVPLVRGQLRGPASSAPMCLDAHHLYLIKHTPHQPKCHISVCVCVCVCV